MDVKLKRIGDNQPELIEIQCHEVTEQVKDIVSFVQSRQGRLTGTLNERQYELAVSDI